MVKDRVHAKREVRKKMGIERRGDREKKLIPEWEGRNAVNLLLTKRQGMLLRYGEKF